ncbi:MAG: radical SAM family heme chaperone HemW [Brotaphodocola sp.]
MNKQALELYIHIPFCVRKCAYCDFLSFPATERTQEQYVAKLIEEIYGQSAGFQEYCVTSIFLGGGTPSILSADLMRDLFEVLYQCFDIAVDAEITIEANPGTLTMEKLAMYRTCGINRISLGLQSADDEELKTLGRIHCYDDFLKSFQRVRQAGFTNINVDLMSALPGQTVQSWKNTLRKVLMLKPEHISAYSLIIEEGTPFYERYHEDKSVFPDEEMDREMYHLTKEIMAAQGFERYEISNYAKPGYECRHNIGYWTGVDYLGLGLGASSYTHRFRYHNVTDMEEYLSLDLSEAGAAARDIQKLSEKEQIEEFMFLGLRMMKGVSGSNFLERFGLNMWSIYGEVFESLEKQGLLEIRKPEVRLTELGIDVSNMVLSEFLLE